MAGSINARKASNATAASSPGDLATRMNASMTAMKRSARSRDIAQSRRNPPEATVG